ncbi:exosortase/archaeosortase family protein, partial [Candidatus Woesearchaeota archaeon]|nr:exosortase/archaeosortase family protein [Candidatus Woesearchaeota archaeon]
FASLFVQLMRNMVAETQTSLSLVFLWYMTSALMVGSLFFSIFPYKSVIEFFSTQKTFISAMIGGSFALYYQVFKGFWHVFALIVAKAVFFMLKIFYPDVTFSMNRDLTPIIGTKAFNVLIAGPCSGIDGVKLFLSLFTFFLVLDWKVINPKRALFLYFAGTLLMFTVNIFRVFSVLVMGNVVNPEFAMASFHTNIGWVLFTAVFIIFEYFTYNWMRER